VKTFLTMLTLFVAIPALAENCLLTSIEDWLIRPAKFEPVDLLKAESESNCKDSAQNIADSRYTSSILLKWPSFWSKY